MTGTETGIGRRSRAERKKKRQERKEKRKSRREERKAGRKTRVAKIALAPARATFLLAVGSNAMKLAEKMARAWKKDRTKLLDFWKKFGGQEDKLKQAIEKGIKAKLNGLGVVGLAAGLSTALPIIMKVLDLLKSMGLISREEEEQDEKDINDAKTNLELDENTDKDNILMPEDNAGNTQGTALLLKKQGDDTETDEEQEENFFQKYKKPLLIAGGVVVAGALIYTLTKKKPQL